MDIILTIVTPKTLEEYENSTEFYIINKQRRLLPFELNIISDNKVGLSTCYNRVLKHPKNFDKICIFMHDDVSLWDITFSEKLIEAHEKCHIIGLAGGPLKEKDEKVKSSSWIDLVKKVHGCVYHQKDQTRWATSFGPMPVLVDLVDGLFISVLNDQKFRDSEAYFNEKFEFHHYDIAFGLEAKKAGLRSAVIDLVVLHKGLGDSIQSKEWRDSNKTFAEEYKYDELI